MSESDENLSKLKTINGKMKCTSWYVHSKATHSVCMLLEILRFKVKPVPLFP